MFSLVRFVEDLIWAICSPKEIKNLDNELKTVDAKFKGKFYPALLINQGTKEDMLLLKQRYLNHDKILEKHFTIIPKSIQTENSHSVIMASCKTIQKRSVTSTTTQTEKIKSVISTSIQTDEIPTVLKISIQTQTEVDDSTIPTPMVTIQDAIMIEIKDMKDNYTQTKNIVSPQKLNVSIYTQTDNINTITTTLNNNLEDAPIVDDILETVEQTVATPNFMQLSNDKDKKMYFCLYCKTKVLKFARHLEIKHKSEHKVSEFLSLPKGDAKRREIINDLRSLGNFKYNTDSTINKGDIIVARRPQETKNRGVKDYVPCPKCKIFFKTNLLHRHYKRCINIKSAPRTLQSLSRATVIESSTNCSRLKDDILPGMMQDDVTHSVQHDSLILKYGEYLCMKHEGEAHLTNMIRQRLRQIGHFLINIKKLSKDIICLKDVLNPKHFDIFIKAIRICAGIDESTGNYRAPSLLNSLGPSIKECAERFISECVKNDNSKEKQMAEAWLCLYGSEYSVISRRANKIILKKKWNKPRLLPLSSDILKLNNYLNDKFREARAILNKGFDNGMWNQLCKTTLLLILIFNRKRVGEMEKLLITDYNQKHNIQKNSVTYNSLSPSEKLFSQRYMRIEMRGKLNRGVSLMINHEQIEAINLILKYRVDANVQFDNEYVFGRGTNKFFEGARCLREAANSCGAEQPGLLRGTKLRKHIATISQALNLTENELGILADFMGHNIDVHRHFYRLPNEAIHLAKISQLLLASDKNEIGKYKGQSLNDITTGLANEQPVENDYINSESESDHGSVKSTISISSRHERETTPTTSRYSDKTLHSPNQSSSDIDWTPHKCVNLTNSKRRSNELNWTPTRKRMKVTRKYVPKRTWRTPEKRVVRATFDKYLRNNKLPTIYECNELISNTEELKGRTAMQIKLWISNEIIKKRKSI